MFTMLFGSNAVQAQAEEIGYNIYEVGRMKQGRAGFQMVVWEDKAYIMGSYTDDVPTESIEIFNFLTGEMEETDIKLPEKMDNFQAVIHEGKIYVIGGWVNGSKGLDTVHIYDIENNLWSQGSPMIYGKKYFSAVLDGDTISRGNRWIQVG